LWPDVLVEDKVVTQSADSTGYEHQQQRNDSEHAPVHHCGPYSTNPFAEEV